MIHHYTQLIKIQKTWPNSLFLFYLNTCSFNKNFDDIEYLKPKTKTTNQTSDVIAINESRIKGNMRITTNINLLIYSIECTLPECHTGGAFLSINNNIAYKPMKVFSTYKSHELEPTFIEIVNPKKSKIILCVVYRHPTMDLR